MSLTCAPFPEGFQGDMDETFQQFCALAEAYIEGNFLTGLYYPVGTTPPPVLPTSDQGPIAANGQWYFWDPVSKQYLPQSQSIKPAKNFAKNCVYQIQQYTVSAVPSGIIKVCDMAQCRSTLANVLAVSFVTGPPASVDTDYCPAAIAYTVGPTLAPTLGSTDLYVHEHLIEGCDIAMLQGEILSLSFSVWVNVAGTYSVYLASPGRDASYVANFSVATASSWIRVKLNNIPKLPTGSGTWNFGEGQTGLYVGVVMALGSQWQTGVLNAWQSAFFAGSSQNSNLCTVANNQIYVSGVKLEASSAVSYLSVPPFEEDFWQTLRYYFSSFNYQSVTAGIPLQFRSPYNTAWNAAYVFRQRMARAPTVTAYGYQTHASGNITNLRGGTAVDIPVATLAATREGISDFENIALTNTTVLTGTVTAIAITGNTTTGSSQIAGVIAAQGQNALPGATITGAGIPANATVLSYNSTSQILYISVAATATGNNVALSLASPTVTALSSTAALQPGMNASGTGVPTGTTIVSIVSTTSVQLSNPVTPGTGISFTFGSSPIQAGDPLLAYVICDARLS